MAFFKKEQKQLAKRMSCSSLQRNYDRTESKLKEAAKSGTEKDLADAMKEHQLYEYALLYKKRTEECEG